MKVSDVKFLLNEAKEKDLKIYLRTKSYIYYNKVGELKEKGFYILNDKKEKFFISYDNVKEIR